MAIEEYLLIHVVCIKKGIPKRIFKGILKYAIMHDLLQNNFCLRIQNLPIQRCVGKTYWKNVLSHIISIVIENTNVFFTKLKNDISWLNMDSLKGILIKASIIWNSLHYREASFVYNDVRIKKNWYASWWLK